MIGLVERCELPAWVVPVPLAPPFFSVFYRDGAAVWEYAFDATDGVRPLWSRFHAKGRRVMLGTMMSTTPEVWIAAGETAIRMRGEK